jgi:hypothetical protein
MGERVPDADAVRAPDLGNDGGHVRPGRFLEQHDHGLGRAVGGSRREHRNEERDQEQAGDDGTRNAGERQVCPLTALTAP